MSSLEHPPSEPTLHTCHIGTKHGFIHPCGKAHKALDKAGVAHSAQVYGKGKPLGRGTEGTRSDLKEISGQEMLPVLALPDGSTVNGSKAIAAWAKQQQT